ncbi:hypothetical protein PMNALOAF_2248 [Methylobacterium adhaesivum]|uniref:Terminase small subunit n=1 Tax=Methylobacterium adhaesivum TaxID=333297 RepID=A0ABT8BMJ3_9HYPH|nr:hypothetical protein [Methylobacterium adhaesivum]MDN3593053.1 hypothetical protein [Methylobacterium adhaesivum]GJD30996.1 hypothetical protein PMNALOAF_2248 [Methylobacterium adhaesivum]
MSWGGGMDDREKLSRLDDLLLAEILSTPDDVILAGIAPGKIDALRQEITTASIKAGKSRMADAKASLVIDRARPVVVSLDQARGAAALKAARAQDRTLDQKLTMAARSGGADYEADRPGIEEDLAELEAWDDEDRGER